MSSRSGVQAFESEWTVFPYLYYTIFRCVFQDHRVLTLPRFHISSIIKFVIRTLLPIGLRFLSPKSLFEADCSLSPALT
jgi:hypothetical protein